MLDLFARLKRVFRGYEPSADAARKRLQLVLVQDRIGMPQSSLESMKQDLLQAISKYLIIDQDSVKVEVRGSGDSLVLVSNVIVRDFVRSGALS